MNDKHSRRGLILLVVLGMLALFSLLAVTYVVFASQTRATSVAHTRRYVRETPSKPLLDEAVKQLIRGTTNPNSSMQDKDILADLYGSLETQDLVRRPNLADEPEGVLMVRNNPDVSEIPMLLGGDLDSNGNYIPGYFLRIPLVRIRPNLTLPDNDDTLTGRIVTFPSGNGPLSGCSFRILRYIGDGTSVAGSDLASSRFSITIDLREADLSRVYSQMVGAAGTLSATRTILDWALTTPHGAYLCYRDGTNFTGGFQMIVNAVPLNGHGIGIGADASSQMHRLPDQTTDSNLGYILDQRIRDFPVSLQQRFRVLPQFGSLVNPAGVIVGDTDEPIDAADYNTPFLAFQDSAGTILPSFHRSALINYIVNFKPFDQWTEAEFWAVIRRIELAVVRPLSISIDFVNAAPVFMGIPATAREYRTHPQFASGTIPTLSMVIPETWDPTLISLANHPNSNFQAWLTALVLGPWDVDNDNDGNMDGIWTDIFLPLQRTADGKLLKALVSYYVEDLDGKIDVNAAGGTAQAGLYATLPGVISPNGNFYTIDVDSRISTQPAGGTQSQGLGYGSADLGFAHLMGKDPSGANPNVATVANPALGYRNLIQSRYGHLASSTSWRPGGDGWDAPGQLRSLPGNAQVYDMAGRSFVAGHRHDRLPGLPIGSRGRVSLVLDRLGNPYAHNTNDIITANESEYEARLIQGSHQDSHFQLAEWERIYRTGDGDRANMPSRLEELFGESARTLPNSTLKREITIRSRHLLSPRLSRRGRQARDLGASSFYELINSIRKLKDESAVDIDPGIFRALFPMEFLRGESFNVNRPFGNGFDSDQNGEIDEPAELVSFQQRAPQATSKYSILPPMHIQGLFNGPLVDPIQSNSGFDPVPLSNQIFGGQESRQLFARHLYCLAQLLVPKDYVFPNIDRDYWRDLVRISRSNGNAQQVNARRRIAQLRAQVLAQWAVNVVDFRDSDAAMTRFPYDLDPFNTLGGTAGIGWFPERGSDGSLTTGNGLQVSVVWGMEQPELLLTESLAFHDIRVRKVDPSDQQRFYDQFRKPEGSLFLELYAPRTTGALDSNLPGVPSSLYAAVGNESALELDKLSPAVPGFQQFPVWRVYITNSTNKSEGTQTYKTPDQRLRAPSAQAFGEATRIDLANQLSVSNLQGNADFWSNVAEIRNEAQRIASRSGLVLDRTPETNQRLNELDPSNLAESLVNPMESRIVLFARNFAPSLANTPGVAHVESQVFTNRTSTNANPLRLFGNQYLVVGPRRTTYLGSRTTSKSDGTVNHPSRHRIELTGNWPAMFRFNQGSNSEEQYRDTGNNVRDAVTIEAAAQIPQDWPTTPPQTLDRIGLNVSEPLSRSTADYYNRPTARANSSNNSPDPQTNAPGFGQDAMRADAYHDFANPNAPVRSPFDNGDRAPLNNWRDPDSGDLRLVYENSNDTNSPRVVEPGTEIDWCTAYLQRLADPEKPWHSVHNPYITVDWIPIDLTVFSGEEHHTELDLPLSLASRQKTGQLVNPNPAPGAPGFLLSGGQTLITSITDSPRASTPEPALPNFLKYQIVGDRGPSNSVRPSQTDGGGAFATLGFLNSTFVLGAESGIAGLPSFNIQGFSGYVGSPADPSGTGSDPTWFPSTVFWANRPFVNAYELSYVPVSSPGQLGQEFSSNDGRSVDRYAAAYQNTDAQMPTSPYSDNQTPGMTNTNAMNVSSHLLNFFQEMPELQTAVSGGRHLKDSSLSQIFELLDTPSAWADVDAVEPPTIFSPKLPANTAILIANNAVLRPYHAPFNTISQRVEPGRINLNTISEANVFQSLLSNILPPNLRAQPNAVAAMWNAFQQTRQGYSPVLGNLPPVTNLNPHFPSQFAGLFKPISEAGMVPATRAQDPSTNTPLHQQASDLGVLDLFTRSNPVHSTLLRASVGNPNAFGVLEKFVEPAFRPSNVPNELHSHVLTDLYSISRLQKLVTERSNVFAVYVTVGMFEYDENIGIGREYGLDNGQNKRLRAFYVIDRSIPVGYRVGQDLNTENTILVRRILSE